MEHKIFESMACKAMHNWQLKAYINCNVMHETNMKGVAFIAKGGSHDNWMETNVIKPLTGRKDFTHKEYDQY